MDAAILSAVMGDALPLHRYAQLLPSWEKMLRIVRADTVRKVAMVAAQIGTETGGLRWQTELASGEAYEGRTDLGNTQIGDGRQFKGRGWIQVTGRHNYTACSRWAYEQGIVDHPEAFISSPELLAADDFCWVGPAWYLTAARPGFMEAAQRGDVDTCTRLVNGGLNGIADRRARYEKALMLGDALLPGAKKKETPMGRIVLPYPKTHLGQDTGWNCGPASVQTIIAGHTGEIIGEGRLAGELGTHRGGTDYIGQFPRVLNAHLGGDYHHRDMPNDPPTQAQRDQLWRDLTGSIRAGYGVVANIVSPPSNRPRAVEGHSPNYGAGTVYHYIAVMGVDLDREWALVVDSGFDVKEYWLSLAQLATLIPPKGYAYATKTKAEEGIFMGLSDEEQRELLDLARDIKAQLTGSPRRGHYPGWEQLGAKTTGENLTLVDAVAALRWDVAALRKELKK